MSEHKQSALPPHLYLLPVTFAFFAAGDLFFLAALLFGLWKGPHLVKTGVFLLRVGLVMCGNIRSDSVVATIGILIMVVDVVIYLMELARVFRY